MTTIACVFCDKCGNVSAVNQHIRSFLDASRTGRHTRNSEHHPLEIVQAFYHQTAQRQAGFVAATPADRLAVLAEFAQHATHHLTSDAEAVRWRKRDFYPRRAAWWARQVTLVLGMYCAAGRSPQLLAAHVRTVVDTAVRESLLNIEDDEDDPALASTVPKTHAAGFSPLLGLPGTAGVFVPPPPPPQTECTTQYTGSQQGNRLGKDCAITNKLTRKWVNNLGTMEQDHARGASAGKIQQRKRGNPPAAAAARSSEYVTISDDELDLDAHGHQPMPTGPRLQSTKRGRAPAGPRSVSSTVSRSHTVAAKARSVSDSAVRKPLDVSAADCDSDSDSDGMGAFVLLHVTGLTNSVQTIPIPFGTSVDAALALALRFAPRGVRENRMPVRFVGHEGSEWCGDWPAWRWEQLMTLAMTEKVELGLRLVMIE